MKCVICHQTLPESSGICPHCGMPPVPELFLNPEQHRQWVRQVFLPAKESYAHQISEQMQALSYNPALFAAAGIDFYAWLDKGRVKLEGFFHSGIRKAEKWENIRLIAAGTGHLAGLSEDGTVFTTGKNTMCQCNVENWKHVVRIAAAGDTTAAVTEDGRLLACGADAERLKEISLRLEKEWFLREIALSQTQILILASHRKKRRFCVICEYYKDVFQEGQGWSAKVPENVRITAGDSGCFLLRNGRAEAVNSSAESVRMAKAVNHSCPEEFDGIAAGRETFFAFTRTGNVFCAEYYEENMPFSFRIPFVNSESVLLNLIEVDSTHLLAVVLDGTIQQLLLTDISDRTSPVITQVS